MHNNVGFCAVGSISFLGNLDKNKQINKILMHHSSRNVRKDAMKYLFKKYNKNN